MPGDSCYSLARSIKVQEERTRAYRNVVDRILRFIGEGSLSPGDKLVSEREMAAALGVSRATLREALRVLEAMGLVRVEREGTFVCEASLSNLAEFMATLLYREKEDVRNLLEFRRLVECQCARLASERAREIDLLRIREAALQHEIAAMAGHPADEADVTFHTAIASATQNRVIEDVMNMIARLLRETYGPTRRWLLSTPDRAREFSRQHWLIYDAIAAGDGEKAERIMSEHFDMVDRYLAQRENASD